MKKTTYIFIPIFLLVALSLPLSTSDRFRSATVASFIPFSKVFSNVKSFFSFVSKKVFDQTRKEVEKLRLENYQLRCQMELLKAQIELEKIVSEDVEILKKYKEDDFGYRRKAELLRMLDLYSNSILGQVVFRESSAWNSSLWINVGEKTNEILGRQIITKNSPVVLGTSAIGVIEYVGENRSRIRLITDGALSPSVRVIRGIEYLAKGEIRGIRKSSFRSRITVLQGFGFNYDFADDEGPNRDLTSEIIHIGDSIVTTGMDGIFPAGLSIGKVCKVYPCRDNSSSYEIDISTDLDFNILSFVNILPSLDRP